MRQDRPFADGLRMGRNDPQRMVNLSPLLDVVVDRNAGHPTATAQKSGERLDLRLVLLFRQEMARSAPTARGEAMVGGIDVSDHPFPCWV